jgi:hypothetical protein
MPSPAQPLLPFTPSELDACVRSVAPLWPTPPNGGPIVLSYATGIAEQWMLGASAAMHHSPLVLAGIGHRGWSWWSGGGGKLPGTARALQLVRALAPEAPVVFADGGDTVVANRWTQAQALATLEAATGGRQPAAGVLTAGECNSWPLCYNETYRAVRKFRACLERGHATCYPNSGAYLGTASDLLGFVHALRGTVGRMDVRGYKGRLQAEKGDDQSALHHLYLATHGQDTLRSDHDQYPSDAAAPAAPAAAAPGVLPRVHIDGSSRFFLSLFACSGRRQFHRRGNGPFEYCHEEPFDAIPDLTASKNGRSLVYAPAAVSLATAARPGRLRDGGGEPTEEERRPFLLHSNGKHYRMKHKALAPIIEQLLVRNASIAAVPELDATPVLLVDLVPPASRKNRPCSVGSLGSVLRGWQRRTVVPDA